MSDISAAEQRRNLRRSTRVPIHVRIELHASGRSLSGETVVVNLHGALLKTSETLEVGGQITLHVSLTGKSAGARVVFADPEQALQFGIALTVPENVWGISLPPEDWEDRPTDVDRQRDRSAEE
jgi:hypothetical protein